MAPQTKSRIFPPFRLDLANLTLWRGNERISLAPKAFLVLQFLVENAGRLVTQEQLLDAIWPETYVQPEVLRKYILEIRRVLEDLAKTPRFVETLPKRGYRFIAEVHEEGVPEARVPAPALEIPSLVGRETALAELNSASREAESGNRQIVFITGEAGIGKTSLVDTFHAMAARSGRVWIARGQCVEGFGGKESYYPVLEALGLFLRAPGGDVLLSALAQHAPTWAIQFPSILTVEQRELLRREIFGATQERMLREICEALEVFAAERCLILLIEDLHLGDESTLDLISAVARRRVPARLMLAATYRPEDAILSGSPLKALKQDLMVHRLCREISLAPLTRQQVGDYLRAEFGGSGLEAELAARIHRSSDGNPLFMVALLERLQRLGGIAKEGGNWRLTVDPERLDPGVPETLQQMLEVQLDQLTEAEQRLLRAASVSGMKFPVWAVAAMTGIDDAAAERLCEELALRQQFIRDAGIQEMPDGQVSAQYEFKHSLYREVLHERLPPTQRRQFHLRLAEKAESLGAARDLAAAPEMAAHFAAARDFARATRYLVASARLAASRYAHADAIQMLRHALELVAHLHGDEARMLEIGILDCMSDVLYAQGDMAQSAEMDYRVVDLAAQPGFAPARIKAWTRLARVLAFKNPEQCVEVCELAVQAARTHGDSLLEARAEMLRACWRIVAGGWNREDAAACHAALERIHGLSAELPAYYEILYAHVQCLGGDYEGACETAASGIPKSLENGGLVVFLSAHSSLAYALLHLGRWGELLRVVSTASGTAEKNGNAPWVAIFQATLGWLRFHAGDLGGARTIAEDLLRTNTDEPAGQVRTMAMVLSGFVSLETGETPRALEYFRAVCERPAYPRFFLDWYWRIVGRLGWSHAWLAAGQLQRAEEEADLALQAALSALDPALQAGAWEAKARIARCASDWNRVGECLEKAGAALNERGVPHIAWRVYAATAEWQHATERAEEADASLRRAAAIVRQLAGSFEEGEPLRQTLLASAEDRGIPV